MTIRTRSTTGRLTAVLGAAALLLAGCGGQQESDAATAEETAGAEESDLQLPEGWQHIVGEGDFAGIQAEPQLPVTVTDGTGTEVEVTDASKIIVAGDGIASTLGALGLADSIYAAPEESTSPEGLAAPEHFEFNKDTGTEGLLAMDGTLFIGDNTARHGDVASQFRDAGTPAVVVDDQQSQLDKLRAVAEYIGDAQAGEELAAAVQSDLDEAAELASSSGKEGLKVIQITATGAGGQNSVAGTGTPGTELIEDLGLVSVGAESGLRGFSREFSNEGILAEQPELIVMAESDYEKWGGEDGVWQAFPTLQQTPAGEANRVFVLPDSQLRYSSPELGAGAKALAEAVAQLP